MPKPWEVTVLEARAAGERKRDRYRAADQEASELYAKLVADIEAEDERPAESIVDE